MNDLEKAKAKSALDASVALCEWMKKQMKYHLWTDHQLVLGDEIIHNVCANLSMAQVEAMRSIFEKETA